MLSRAPQTCVTNPQGPGGRSVQDQSAAPQQGRSTLHSHTPFMSVCVTVLYVCDHGVGTEVTEDWEVCSREEKGDGGKNNGPGGRR